MFPFDPGRILFFSFLLLTSVFLLAGCKSGTSYVPTDPTQITVVDFSGTERQIIEVLDSALNSVQLAGTSEPFFSSVEIRPLDRGKLPQSSNLLILISTATLQTDTALKRIFSKEVLDKTLRSDEALFIKRDNLFFEGQVAWLLLYPTTKGLQSFIDTRLSPAIATIMSTNINRIITRNQPDSRYEKDISALIIRDWAIDLKLPEGFEAIDSLSRGSALYRRGAGTKTEEWILISDIKDADSIGINSLRDSITERLIRYQDGSKMRTVTGFEYLGSPGYYRGRWETAPYPMAGLFTTRIVKQGKKTIYIEAGIYSPGRNKTLNLLRLEKLLRDLE